MSVQTTADDHLDSAREHIASALEDLSEIIVKECWGHDDFNEEWRKKIHQTFQDLLKMKKRFQ